MKRKWLPISKVETMSHDAPVGYVGLRVLCYTKNDGSATKSFPSKRGATWPFPEDRTSELIRSLSQADPQAPIAERPRIQITLADNQGGFTGFWPGPSTIG